MKLLGHIDILRKIKRITIEILEKNYQEKEIILAGINKNGTAFAKLLFDECTKRGNQQYTLTTITLSPANPLERKVEAGLYEYEDAGISVAYSDVPEIEGGEDVGGYAERIADWINDAIGAWGDSRVHLCAATAEEA